MIHVGPGPIQKIDRGVKHAAHESESPGLTMRRERSGMLGIFPAVHIDTAPVFRRSFDAGESERHAPIRIRAAEPTPVAPGGVQLIIWSPGDGPQITSRRGSGVGLPLPRDALNLCALRIRRLGQTSFGLEEHLGDEGRLLGAYPPVFRYAPVRILSSEATPGPPVAADGLLVARKRRSAGRLTIHVL